MMRLIYRLLTIIFISQNITAQQKNLEYYVGQGLQNSPLLKDYDGQMLLNRMDSMRIRASFGPQVQAVSNNSYAPVFNGWGYNEAITNGANISAVISVSQEIVSSKNRKNQFEVLQWQNQSLTNSKKISEQDLKKTITEQYIIVYGLWQLYTSNNDILNLLKKEDLIFRKLTERSLYKQTEYLTFLTALQQQELLVLQTKIQIQNNFSILNYFCGIRDPSVVPIDEPQLTIADLPILENSLFYQQFVIDSLKMVTNDKQIDFLYQPKASVFADAGYISSLVFQPAKNVGTSIGLSLSVPIYDGHQRKIQHNKIAMAEQTRKNYRDFFSNQYQQQIQQLLDQLKGNQQVAELAAKQIKVAQTLVDANHKLIETGDAPVAESILAINNLISAKSMIVQNTIEKYRIINQINYWSRKK